MFEAHPVPQNVTEFEFHLVGDMTIKQFVYLAAGIGLAYLTFALLAPKVPFLAYPLIILFAGSGAALAFLPIQDRPLDHWLGAYFRAIFQPTKRLYKSKLITKEDPLFKTRLQVYLNSKRNPVAPIIPNGKTKSTPFSFSMTSIHDQDGKGAPAPIIGNAPAPVAPVAKDPSKAFSFAENSSPAIQGPPVVLQSPPVSAPQTTVLGSASLSSMDIPQQKTAPIAPALQAAPPTEVKKPAPTPAPPSAVPQTPTAYDASVASHVETIVAPAPVAPVAQVFSATPPAVPGQQTAQNSIPASPIPNIPLPAPVATSLPGQNPSEDELNKTIAIAKQVHEVQQNIIKTEEQINLIRSKAATQDANPKEYLDQFHQLLGDLQGLQNKAAQLSQEVAVLTKEPIKAVTAQPEPVVKPKSIPTITLTSIANIINGIVTDGAGNYLDGAIILAHDKQGIPVRALKTNKLGQFVAATPLNNGIYTITIEKDTLVFDTIEIELTGVVLKPILITAKPTGGVAHG